MENSLNKAMDILKNPVDMMQGLGDIRNLLSEGISELERNPAPERVFHSESLPSSTPSSTPSTPSQYPPLERYSATTIEDAFTPYSSSERIILSPLLSFKKKAANEVWSVYGKRGSGKSYFLGKLGEELNRIDIPFVILDVIGAHSLMQMPNLSHVHASKVTSSQMVKRLGSGESIIVSMRGLRLDEIREFVSQFCDDIGASNFGPTFKRAVVVCLEECHNFVGQGQGTAGGDSKIRSQCFASVDKLIREGRQPGVGVVLISQSVANVMSSVRRQAEIKIIFNVKDSTDIQQLRKTLIGKSPQDVDAIINKVFYFDVGEFVCVSPTYIKGSGIVLDKTSPRTTEHAGRSFLDDGPSPDMGNPSPVEGFTLHPDVAVNIDDDDDDDVDGDDDKDKDRLESFNTPDKPFIDYKTALSMSLMALVVIGIIAIVIKKRIEKRDVEKEQEIEHRLKTDRLKIDAMRQRQEKQGTGTVSPPQSPISFDDDNSDFDDALSDSKI